MIRDPEAETAIKEIRQAVLALDQSGFATRDGRKNGDQQKAVIRRAVLVLETALCDHSDIPLRVAEQLVCRGCGCELPADEDADPICGKVAPSRPGYKRPGEVCAYPAGHIGSHINAARDYSWV